MKKTLLMCYSLVIMAVNVFSQQDSTLSQLIDKYVKAEAENDLFSGAILVVKEGEIIYKDAYGYANKENKMPNKINTKFNVGSVGKTFTGVLIMQLVEQSKIKLSDTLGKYLPDFPFEEKNKIQIQHLLNHTSGLGNYFTHKDYDSLMPVLRRIDDALKLVYDQKPLFEPGTEYRYSNSGMLVLGAIIEKVTGMSYQDYIKKQILDPLGMENSGIYYPEDNVSNRAIGYSKVDEGNYKIETQNEFPAFSDGGLYSTVLDMYKYDVAIRENRLLTQASKDIMLTVIPPAQNYGFGWERGVFNESEFVGHVGGCPGFAADYKSFLKDQMLIIVISNYDGGANLIAAKINHLLFGASEKNIPLASKYDFNFEKGRYLSEVKKDYKAALEYLDKNISGSQPHLPSLFLAARSRILSGFEVEKAIGLLQRYIELNPQASKRTQSALWWLSGKGYEQLDSELKAIECYKKSLEISPDYNQAKESLIQLNEKK
ncbi:MAG: beta-lactamase family protein [Bacteroidetes bacterium]|nr:beta-lactamase family protein [Bacteroidota bacterium]